MKNFVVMTKKSEPATNIAWNTISPYKWEIDGCEETYKRDLLSGKTRKNTDLE